MAALVFACIAALPRVAAADTYYYVAWSKADVAHGTASGKITLPDKSVVTVQFQAINSDGSQGNLYGAQVKGTGTNYWTPAATFKSKQVQNPPPDPDILQLSGGQNETYKVTLSAPIVDPIMAVVSLGSSWAPCTYNFDAPFTIESQGTDRWSGPKTGLSVLPKNVLRGAEGSGIIQFIGTYSTFSWTVPKPETWHGFTFGIRTTLALDPAAAPAAGQSVAIYGIHFDFDKSKLRSDSLPALHQVLGWIQHHPGSHWIISGHTDSQGTPEHNQPLSERRAASVVAWLEKHGVEKSRLVSKGFGATRPVADNSTAAGRALNRRVEVALAKSKR